MPRTITEGERKEHRKRQIIFGDTRQHDIGLRIPAVVRVTLRDALEEMFVPPVNAALAYQQLQLGLQTRL